MGSNGEEVIITCQPKNNKLLDNIVFQCLTFYNCYNTSCIYESNSCLRSHRSSFDCQNRELQVDFKNSYTLSGGLLRFSASVINICNIDDPIIWKNDLFVCVTGIATICTNTNNCSLISITTLSEPFLYSIRLCYWNITKSSEVTLSIATQSLALNSTNRTVILRPCMTPFQYIVKNQTCSFIYNEWFKCRSPQSCGSKFICSSECSLNDTFVLTISADNCVSDESEGNGSYTYVSGNCPIFYNSLFNRSNYNIEQSLLSTVEFCQDGGTGRLCGACSDGYGVPLNVLNGCNKCDNIGFLLFIFVELLPTTIFVLVILVFNIKFTNGSINGFVFYCQIITIVYSGLTLNVIFSTIKKKKVTILVMITILLSLDHSITMLVYYIFFLVTYLI